jgi:hypothetical protein
MSGESDWVKSLQSSIEDDLGDKSLKVEIGFRLPYALNIKAHKTSPTRDHTQEIPGADFRRYQTDLLIAEVGEAKWIPRVVVEFKLGGVNMHDVLTYSAKAATHKSLYPHLRYGIVIGEHNLLPTKLLWHGHNFDFMLAFQSRAMRGADRDKLSELLRLEVKASQTLGDLLISHRSKASLIHRKLTTEF